MVKVKESGKDVIGQGGFGTVRLGVLQGLSPKTVAVKIIQPPGDEEQKYGIAYVSS